jgi:ABC-2 type transport system permease protein
MRNIVLVMKREYLERVRKKSFLIMTVLVPALMGFALWIPIKIATKNSIDKRHIAVVTPSQTLTAAVKEQLLAPVPESNPFTDDGSDKGPKKTSPSPYTVDESTDLSDANKQALTQKVSDGKLNGFLWVTPEALRDRKFTYYSKDSTNFSEQEVMRSALRFSLTKEDLTGHGLNQADVDRLLKPVSIDAKRVERGKESKTNGATLFLATMIMVTLLYVTVLIYGITVMRSVIEEKSSRIMEVMLSCVTPRDLMAGKIIGVGAVGLTQIAIWVVLSIAISTPAVAAIKSMGGGVNISTATIAYFAVFFLLGYLLYSTLYAAIGAMVNSEQEAQQVQFVVLTPLIFAMIIAGSVIQQPSSQLAIWTSMIPFCAPMLMFVRIIIETPPWWQIALCIALMVGPIVGLLQLCGRIYRVGILMYGKRPTLPELLKWLKYAG